MGGKTQSLWNLMVELENDLTQDLILTEDRYKYCLNTTSGEPTSQGIVGVNMKKNRILLEFRQPHLMNDVLSFLNEKGEVYSSHHYEYSDPEIIIYPDADKDLLSIQAQPTEGNVQIIQGEYALTNAKDPNPVLSTFGIGSCTGLLLYDPENKIGGIAHVDFWQKICETLGEMKEELDRQGAGNLVFGRSSNIDPMIEEYQIMRNYGDKISEKIELPTEFSFDTRTGEIGSYQPSEDPTLEKRMGEKTQHRLEGYITRCFPVYRSTPSTT